MVVGKEVGGLYTFDSSHLKGKTFASAPNVFEVSPSSAKPVNQDSLPYNNSVCKSHELDVLHARLGHTSFTKMQHIANCKPFLYEFFYETCVLAKFHRSSFNKSATATKAPLHLLYIDLWGLYKVTSVSGARYFLIIIDDFSRSTWTHMLKDKHKYFLL